MDSSKFNVWRACFAFCQIDKELAIEERKWIEEKSNTLPFTEEQRTILLGDLNSPPDINSILPLITKPSDRAFLVDQMRFLSRIDGTFAPEEKRKIEQIRSIVLSKVNLVAAEAQVAADEMTSYHEDEVYKVNNKHSFVERLHRFAQKTLNPGDHKFPGKK